MHTSLTTRSRTSSSTGQSSAGLPILLGVLLSRTALFALLQLLVAALLLAGGASTPLADSAAWWPLVVAITNAISVALLAWLLSREGSSLWQLYRVERASVARDLLLTLGILVVSGVLAYVPNIALGTLLFGDPMAPLALMFRPLPLWAALVSVIFFPLTIGFAELPTYFGYVLPRLQALTGRPWAALLLTSFWLAAQHVALPLVLDWRFVIWRLGMFLPFALFIGLALWRRPRLLPYLLVMHGLLDLQVALMLLPAAQQ